jgi:hypothetical protein
MDWQVTSSGSGTETVLVIASPEPRAELEREIAAFPAARVGAPIRYGRLSERTLDALRGFGGLVERKAIPVGNSRRRLTPLIRRLMQEPRVSGVPWVWLIELRNRG